MSYQDDLDWLARNVHTWPKCIIDGEHRETLLWIEPSKGDVKAAFSSNPLHCFNRDQWLARRAELQHKPSWDQHSWPQIFQNEDGHWFGAGDGWDFYAHIGRGWKGDGVSMLRDDGEYLQTGTVLGDWRDTLEKRPVDMHKITPEIDTSADCWCSTCRPVTITDMRFVVCPECGNKRCPKANDHRNACTGSNELGRPDSAYPADTKGRDMDNSTSWHESGELPPVGVFVDVTGDVVYGEGEKGCEVIAHVEGCAVIRMSCGLGCFEAKVLSPTSTWRDEAIEAMKALCPYPGSWDTTYRLFAEALYDAGYRAGGSE